MRSLVLLVALAACAKTDTVTCPNGLTCPAGSECYTTGDGVDYCLGHDQLTACVGLPDATPCTIGIKQLPGLCREGVCYPARCGDGFRVGDEQCDGADVGADADCAAFGFYYSHPLTCNAACSYAIDGVCTGICGDAIVDPGFELCDGSPPARSCSDMGYGAGFLGCTQQCGPDIQRCHLFGWDPPAITGVATHANMEDVHGVDDGRVVAAGLEGTLIRYDGANWFSVDLSGCGPLSTLDLYSVWTFGDSILVGGAGGKVLRVVDVPPPATCTVSKADGDTGTITDLWAASETDVYAVSPNGISHFDGTTWSMSSTTTGLTHLWGSGPDDIYAVGGTTTLRRTGGAWTVVNPGTFSSIKAVWGSSASDVYVGGLDGGGAAHISHYNGATWAPLGPPQDASIDVGGVAVGRVFVAGTSAISHVFDFDGLSWIDLQLVATGSPTGLWMSSTGALFLTDLTNRVFRFPGAQRIDELVTSDEIKLIRAASSNAAYAVTTGTDTGGIYLWDGTSWAVDGPIGSTGITEVSVAPDGSTYILEPGVGLRLRGAPQTWSTKVSTTDAKTADHVWAASLNDVWFANNSSGSGSTLTHWNGSTLSVPAALPFNVLSIAGASSSDIWAVGRQALVAHWNGSSWATIPTPTPVFNWWAVATCGKHVFMAGSSGALAHFDGAVWSISQLPQQINATDIWCSSDKDVFVSAPSGYVYWFDGQNWSPVKSGTPYTVKTVTGAGDTVFLGDETGGFHRLIRTTPW